MRLLQPLFFTIMITGFLGCQSGSDGAEQASAETSAAEEAPATTTETTDTDMSENPEVAAAVAEGLIITDTEIGDGAVVQSGTVAHMHYTGWLYDESKPDNKGEKFDSSYDRGDPLPVQFGIGRVIKGWDLGVLGMKVGGKRTLVIPPELGYGQRGTPGGPIPPNATLLFDVEVVSVD